MHIITSESSVFPYIVTTHIFIFKEKRSNKKNTQQREDTTSKEIFITRRYEHFYYLSFKNDNFPYDELKWDVN